MKKCFRCERILPNFMYRKTNVPHLNKLGLTHGFSCKICLFKKAWGYGIKDLEKDIRLEKAILRHKKDKDDEKLWSVLDD